MPDRLKAETQHWPRRANVKPPAGLVVRDLDERLDAVLIRLMDELSIYSAEYDDGREVISECFSGYYSKSGSEFAEQYVKRCLDIVSAKGR